MAKAKKNTARGLRSNKAGINAIAATGRLREVRVRANEENLDWAKDLGGFEES
jgi:hypothetical protein